MTTKISGDTGVEGTVPVGCLIDFAGTSAPANYLACPLVATNISRTTYAKLFSAIGTTWGAGDGSTTFGMPYFPANHAAVNANANVGTATVGETISHTHTGTTGGQSQDHVHYYNRQDWGAGVQGGTAYTVGGPQSGYGSSGSSQDHSHSFTSNATGGAANLAAGVRVLKCVRYQ